MTGVIKVVLVLFYFLFLPGVRVVTFLLGRDALQRRRRLNSSGYWLARNASGSMESYFSQQAVEELNAAAAAGYLMPFFLFLARLSAPPGLRRRRFELPVAGKEAGIPDEIYTLW